MLRFDRYIFREILTPTLIGLVALTFVAFSREIGRLLESIIKASATPAELWAVSAAILPTVLRFTIPMALLVGILTGFGRMSSDCEAIALRAVGIPMRRILRPVLLVALLAWGANIALTTWIAPRTAVTLRNVQNQIAMKQVAVQLEPRVFNEKLNNFVLYFQDLAPGGFEFRGIMLANMSKPDDPSVTFARSGTLRRDETNRRHQLTLSHATTLVSETKETGRYSTSTVDTTDFPIDIGTDSPKLPTIAETPTRTLWDRIRGGQASYDEEVEFHTRLAFPFACIAFALVGLPLGISTTRSSKSMGLVLSLILMLAYYLVFFGGTRIAANAQFSPFFGAWLPNLAFALLGGVLLIRSDREYENRGLAWLKKLMESLSAKDTDTPEKAGRTGAGRWVQSFSRHSKLLRVLDIYVLSRFWFYFTLVLVVFVALFSIVTLFQLLPDIIKNNASTSTVVKYFLFLIPFSLYWVVPLTVLLAILIDLGTLTKTNEILAVKAGGISLYRFAIPLVLMGLVVSGGVYLMQDFMLPYSNQLQNKYLDVIKGRAPQTYGDPQRKWMMGTENRIYHYNYFDAAGNVFGGLSVFKFEPQTFELTEWAFAEKAVWNDASWTFDNPLLRRASENRTGFYDAPASEFPRVDIPDYFKKEVGKASQMMTYLELKRYVQGLKESGFDVTAITVELNRKLSFPLVSFIMAIIAVPFSFSTGKKGAFYGIGLSVALGIVYWSTFELFDKLGSISRLDPTIAAWFPNLIFGLGGLWLMLKVKT